MSATMIDIHRLELLPDVNEEDFERFMTEEAFPAFQPLLTRAGLIDKHFLLKEPEGTRGDKYLWIVEWTLRFGLEVLHAIPDSISNLSHKRKGFDSFCTRTSFERMVRVGEWHRPEETPSAG